jgi:hypothetical protein
VTGYLWAILVFLGGLAMTALGDMVSEEVRDRLDHLPHAILRLAALRLDPCQRATVYQDEWLPELAYILRGDEARPVTRLVHGTYYALGILAAVGRIGKRLNRPIQAQPSPAAEPPSPPPGGGLEHYARWGQRDRVTYLVADLDFSTASDDADVSALLDHLRDAQTDWVGVNRYSAVRAAAMVRGLCPDQNRQSGPAV